MINNQLEKIYIQYHRDIYLYAYSLCKNYHMAQDLTSDTFFKALLSLDENKKYIKFWLFRVCKNLFLDNIRKAKEFSNTEGIENILSTGESTLDKIIDNEEKRQLYNKIISLRPSYREILILYYYCDFTLKEISETTGYTEGASKTLLFRARKKLKISMEEINEI